MDIDQLVKLTSRAWSLSILAQLHRGTPGRQAPLIAATGASRAAFAQSLRHLFDLKLLEKNPGHGHPLRPEFRLTEQGKAFAAMADSITRAVPRPEGRALIRRSWTVPILTTLQAPQNFTTIRNELAPITDRALSQSLQRLEAQSWVAREVNAASHPPRPIYRAINAGKSIGSAARALR